MKCRNCYLKIWVIPKDKKQARTEFSVWPVFVLLHFVLLAQDTYFQDIVFVAIHLLNMLHAPLAQRIQK
ncbi:hypothetical protein A3844_14695 [Paenibacillus helianthi]|uniref:Uncharacterized protein n=1 Tax=Paenibacillus helianthi TaxID=1349432 RepID=A0ABX3EQA9_9BACL|nr:hypothetical protein A3844_14695 [Paenibacillus helianthi]